MCTEGKRETEEGSKGIGEGVDQGQVKVGRHCQSSRSTVCRAPKVVTGLGKSPGFSFLSGK